MLPSFGRTRQPRWIRVLIHDVAHRRTVHLLLFWAGEGGVAGIYMHIKGTPKQVLFGLNKPLFELSFLSHFPMDRLLF